MVLVRSTAFLTTVDVNTRSYLINQEISNMNMLYLPLLKVKNNKNGDSVFPGKILKI